MSAGSVYDYIMQTASFWHDDAKHIFKSMPILMTQPDFKHSMAILIKLLSPFNHIGIPCLLPSLALILISLSKIGSIIKT